MKNLKNHDIRVLNNLVETTIDSSEGYAEAAKDSKNAQFSDNFRSWSRERRRVAEILKARVISLGGNPEDGGTMLASAQRLFVHLHETLSSGDIAVADEMERGEDHIQQKYEEALGDEGLSPSTRSVIEQALASVRIGRDQTRDLKHSLHAQQ